jgi:hypothetical protein
MKQLSDSNSNLIRLTTLITPNLLSKIKLISFLSNQKLYETINICLTNYIEFYNSTHQTNIDTLINLPTPNNLDLDTNSTNTKT